MFVRRSTKPAGIVGGLFLSIAGLLVFVVAFSDSAFAHWCDCTIGPPPDTGGDTVQKLPAINLVMAFAEDEIQVSNGNTVTVNATLCDYLPYPLPNVEIAAEADNYTIKTELGAGTVDGHGWMLPGECRALILRVQGNRSLDISDIVFYFNYGAANQNFGDREPVIMGPSHRLLKDLTISESEQAQHLNDSLTADYVDFTTGIKALIRSYCAGRGSWVAWSKKVLTTHCSGNNTSCPDSVTRDPTKYDYYRLWAGLSAVARQNEMQEQHADVLRERAMCAWNDSHPAFLTSAALILGYLRPEKESVTDFLMGKLGGTDLQAAAASAALVLLGHRELAGRVRDNMSSSDKYIALISTVALGTLERDDSIITQGVLDAVDYENPEVDPFGFLASHFLTVTVMDRLRYKPMAAYEGAISFYGESDTPVAAPGAPTNLNCVVANGTVTLTWERPADQSTAVAQYRVYWGMEANTCPQTCTRPGEGVFDYARSAPVYSTTFETPTDLQEEEVYYFSVVAEESHLRTSVYSNEASCVAPKRRPTAVLNCTPTSGSAPLTVACDGLSSTSPTGSVSQYFLAADDGQEVETSSTSFTFSQPGVHVVTLRAVGDSGAQDFASLQIEVTGTTNGDALLSPTIIATPSTGAAPLTVSFGVSMGSSSSGSDNLAYRWTFDGGDAQATGANVEYTYTTAGLYRVTLAAEGSEDPPRIGWASTFVDVARPANRVTLAEAMRKAHLNRSFGDVPLTVTADASEVVQTVGGSATVQWNFGADEASCADATCDHEYAEAGAYEVVLTVQQGSQQKQRTFSVTAYAQSSGAFTGAPSVGCSATPAPWAVSFLLALLFAARRFRRPR